MISLRQLEKLIDNEKTKEEIVSFLFEDNEDNKIISLASYGACYIAKTYEDKEDIFKLFFDYCLENNLKLDDCHVYGERPSCYYRIFYKGEIWYSEMPLLAISSAYGNAPIVNYLLSKGANPNIKYRSSYDNYDRSILFDAIKGEKVRAKGVSYYGYGKVVDLLLKSGANPFECSDENGWLNYLTARNYSRNSFWSSDNSPESYQAIESFLESNKIAKNKQPVLDWAYEQSCNVLSEKFGIWKTASQNRDEHNQQMTNTQTSKSDSDKAKKLIDFDVFYCKRI